MATVFLLRFALFSESLTETRLFTQTSCTHAATESGGDPNSTSELAEVLLSNVLEDLHQTNGREFQYWG